MPCITITFIPVARSLTFLFLPGIEPEVMSRIIRFPDPSAIGRELSLLGDKTDLHLIEHIIAAVKHCRTFARGIQQIAQRRDRAIMKIRRAQPDAIERAIGVTEGLVKMT